MQVTSPGKSDQQNLSWLHAYEFQFPFDIHHFMSSFINYDIHHDFAYTVSNLANSSIIGQKQKCSGKFNWTVDLVTKD